MSVKSALTSALWLFVVASIMVLTVKSLRRPTAGPASATTAASPESSQAAASEPTPADGLIAYYFHGKIRCPTCRSIENYAREAIQAGFPEELRQRQIHWRVVNYDEPGNEHFVLDYELACPSVVLVKMSGGKRTQWKNLPELWELVENKPAFMAFIQNNVRELLNGRIALR
ncbi:MAG: nitrophenyl compound nitroreductase subunit ArsF family protein [Thermoguttaceae bacterium]